MPENMNFTQRKIQRRIECMCTYMSYMITIIDIKNRCQMVALLMDRDAGAKHMLKHNIFGIIIVVVDR